MIDDEWVYAPSLEYIGRAVLSRILYAGRIHTPDIFYGGGAWYDRG